VAPSSGCGAVCEGASAAGSEPAGGVVS